MDEDEDEDEDPKELGASLPPRVDDETDSG